MSNLTRSLTLALTVIMAIQAPILGAQSAKSEIARGDKAVIERKGDEALSAYLKALESESGNIEAMVKAVTTATALSEFALSPTRSTSELIGIADKYSKLAMAKDPKNPESSFVVAQALGRAALVGGPMARLKNSPMIYSNATSCLKAAPKHAGCAHIMGNWHAEVMRLSTFELGMAKRMMENSHLLDSASWENAIRYMNTAIKNDPDRIVHIFALARIYNDKGEKEKATELFKKVGTLKLRDFNDEQYKDQAKTYLLRLNAKR